MEPGLTAVFDEVAVDLLFCTDIKFAEMRGLAGWKLPRSFVSGLGLGLALDLALVVVFVSV